MNKYNAANGNAYGAVVATELSVEQIETELAGELMVRPIKMPRKSMTVSKTNNKDASFLDHDKE